MRHRGRAHWRGRLAVASVVAVAAAAAASLVGSAQPASSTFFPRYTPSVAPASILACTDVELTVTIKNSSLAIYKLGSASVTVPSGFTDLSVVGVSPPAGKTWSATIDGNVVKLRNPGPFSINALAPGQAVSVTIGAHSPSPGSYVLATAAKQTNDFSGFFSHLARVGSDPTVAVGPGPLDHFELATIGTQQAGTEFDVTATAYDTCGNVKTDYAGGATLSGDLGTSPGGYAPAYGAFEPWSGGSSNAPVTAYRAETGVHVTAADGAVTNDSNLFEVEPGPLASLAFVQQPTNRQFDQQPITPPVTVSAADAYGNPIEGASVGLAIDPTTGTPGATLAGTIPASTDVTGVASFADLVVSAVGLDYRLDATSDSVSATSSEFDIVDQLVACAGASCNASTSKASTTTTVNASGTQGGDALALSLLTGTAPPSGLCGSGFTPLGAESVFEVSGSSSQPSYEVTWRLDKSIVNAQPENGASHFDICLGSKRVTQASCSDAPADGFFTKSGAKATCDPTSGLYWGLLPDKKGYGACTKPSILSRKKEHVGDVVIKFCIPYPWDPRVFGG